MSGKKVESFLAIRQFVYDLSEVFGSSSNQKPRPLDLYKRLLQHIDMEKPNIVAIDKFLDSFKAFLRTYEVYFIDDQMDKIPRGTKIEYGTSGRVYIDIQRFIHKSDPETKQAIRTHIMTIGTILDPSEDKLKHLEKQRQASDIFNIDDGTSEGAFVSGIFEKVQNAMGNNPDLDMDDPQSMMMAMMSSGVLPDVMNGMKAGISGGKLDMTKMWGLLQKGMNAMMAQTGTASVPQDNVPSPSEGAPKVEEVVESGNNENKS